MHHLITSNKIDITMRHTFAYKIEKIDTLKIYGVGKHFKKRRNCLQQAISPFLTMFFTLYGTYF